MLTVKLYRKETKSHSYRVRKILEANSVEIRECRENELYELSGVTNGDIFWFYIADDKKDRPDGFSNEIEFWSSAYIENSAGATTEVIKF